MPTQSTQARFRFSRSLRFALVVLLLLSALPGAVLAAPGIALGAEMDPDARAKAEQAVAQVGLVLSETGSAQAARPSQDAPPPKSPADAGEPVAYSASGVTLTAPANWVVEESPDEIFTLSLPGEFVFGFMDQEPAQAFPGVFAIVLFEQQSDLLATSMGEDVALQEVVRFETEQGLPGLNIRFGGMMEGLDMGGSMYMVAASDATYMLIILSTTNAWDDLQADADAIAASITAENPLVMVGSDEGEMDYVSDDGLISLVLPTAWKIQEIEDEDISAILVDPEMSFVAAGKWESAATLQDADDLGLYNALLAGVIGSENEAAILEMLVRSMSPSDDGTELVLDEASVALMGDADTPILRVGATMTGDGIEMPTMVYLKANEDGMAGLMVMGNMDRILDNEEILAGVLNSVTFQ